MPTPKNIVPIESLTAIPKGDPRTRVSFDGNSIPRAPATRHIKPRAFSRQRIEVGKHGRAWTYCRADEVELGDMVVDIGLVVDVQTKIRYVPRSSLVEPPPGSSSEDIQVAVGTDIVLTGLGGNVGSYDAEEQVRAFKREITEVE